MRLLTTVLLAVTAFSLQACCGPNECNLPEGSSCAGDYQCAGVLRCFDAQCRATCAASSQCASGQNCVPELPTSSTTSSTHPISACVPAPGATEFWRVQVLGVANATGGSGELGAPEPFVCLVIDQSTLCTEEQEGTTVSFATRFTTTFPTTLLSNISVTVFESDDIGTFQGCEGSCSSLAGVTKEVLHAEAIDGRPMWSLHKQPWTLLGANALQVDLEIVPAQ